MSNPFFTNRSINPHLLRPGGLKGEVLDLRNDVSQAFDALASLLGKLDPDGTISVGDATPTAFSNLVTLPDGWLSRVDYLITCDDGAGNFYIYAAQVWAKRSGASVTIIKTIELGTPPIGDEITVGGTAITPGAGRRKPVHRQR